MSCLEFEQAWHKLVCLWVVAISSGGICLCRQRLNRNLPPFFASFSVTSVSDTCRLAWITLPPACEPEVPSPEWAWGWVPSFHLSVPLPSLPFWQDTCKIRTDCNRYCWCGGAVWCHRCFKVLLLHGMSSWNLNARCWDDGLENVKTLGWPGGALDSIGFQAAFSLFFWHICDADAEMFAWEVWDSAGRGFFERKLSTCWTKHGLWTREEFDFEPLENTQRPRVCFDIVCEVAKSKCHVIGGWNAGLSRRPLNWLTKKRFWSWTKPRKLWGSPRDVASYEVLKCFKHCFLMSMQQSIV